MSQKVLLLGHIFGTDIFLGLHVLRYPESKNHIYNGWSLCVCVCLSVCYQHNSKTNYSRNIKLGILHLYHVQMQLETFYKDRTKTLRTGAYKMILMHYGLWAEFLVNSF